MSRRTSIHLVFITALLFTCLSFAQKAPGFDTDQAPTNRPSLILNQTSPNLESLNPIYDQITEPTLSEYQQFLQQVRGTKGLTLFGVAFILVQILNFALRGPLGSLIGVHRLLLLSILSVMVTIGTKMTAGFPLIEALTDAPTLMAFQVFAHQAMKQWGKRDADRKELNPDSFDSGDGDSSCEVFNSETQT